jgi:hypothetical protein
MQNSVESKFLLMNDVLNLRRPERMPMGDYGFIEYKPDIYHLGSPEYAVKSGEVGISRNGKKRYTQDGGVWAVGDKDKYKSYEDVLNVNLDDFVVEEICPDMLSEMSRLYDAKAKSCFPVPMHYGTLITRATIEFGWEPFLTAFAIDPKGFGQILNRLGQSSLAIIQGWAEIDEVKLITIHDDIAGTRGVLIKPEWYREYVFPCYKSIFDAIHDKGKKVLYMSDGNYLEILDDILALNPDGLYVESTSMKPRELMSRSGKDKLYLIKTDSLNIDFGTPDDIFTEILELHNLHEDFPGMMIYMGGGKPRQGNAEAFNRYCNQLLVYK